MTGGGGEGGVIAFSGGQFYMCALFSGGSVKCAGQNDFGELGYETPGFSNSAVPLAITGVNNAVEISAGIDHACALLSTGLVDCWGNNDWDEVGIGDAAPAAIPVPSTVQNLCDVVNVSAGYLFTCAVLSNGKVACWGKNTRNVIGLADPDAWAWIPVVVDGVSNAVKVAASTNHTCALLADHTVRCWGDGAMGQVGDGTDNLALSPVAVIGLNDAVDIVAGVDFTCVRTTGGLVKCWGRNDGGQIGTGTSEYVAYNTPQTVVGLSGVVDISAGGRFACAVLSTGQVACWGNNDDGQVAPTLTNVYTLLSPMIVDGVSNVVSMGSGCGTASGFNCVIRSDGSLECWGDNSGGQLGTTTQYSVTGPVPVVW